jgi:hypothetical protein
MKVARQIVRIAPQNPESYLTLGGTISGTAARVRQGKFIGQMTEAELATVEKIYPEWLEMVLTAVKLDPQFARAWSRVSTAAAFAGYGDVAVKAWERSKQLSDDPYDIYSWGLQLFQEKWGGTKESLAAVAREAAEADYPNSVEAGNISNTLQSLGFQNEASRLIRRYTKE